MKRWGLVFALLLSLGVNLGVLGMIAVHRLRPHHRPAERRIERPEERRAERPGEGERVPVLRIERLAGRLGLEGEARRRFVEQQRSFFLATRRDRDELARVHAQLRRELTAAAPDRARVEALTGQAGNLYVSLERAMAANVLATRGLLDPGQEQLYLDFVSRLRPGRLGPPRDGERPHWRRRWRDRRGF